MLPGIERKPRKKLEPSAERLLGLVHRWRDEVIRAGRKITRIALAFEAGRDGFWLARWIRAHGWCESAPKRDPSQNSRNRLK
jgi:transposase